MDVSLRMATPLLPPFLVIHRLLAAKNSRMVWEVHENASFHRVHDYSCVEGQKLLDFL